MWCVLINFLVCAVVFASPMTLGAFFAQSLFLAPVGIWVPGFVSVISVGCSTGLLWDPLGSMRFGACRGLIEYDCTEWDIHTPKECPWTAHKGAGGGGPDSSLKSNFQAGKYSTKSWELWAFWAFLISRYCLQTLWTRLPEGPRAWINPLANHQSRAAN